MDGDLALMLTDEVQVAKFQHTDQYGKRVFQPAEAVKCRLFNPSRLSINVDGVPVFVTAEVYLDLDANVTPKDQLTLPDGSTPAIVRTEVLEDEDGRPYATCVLTA